MVKTQEDKKNYFRKGFDDFLQSEKDAQDYMKLFVSFRNATNFGSGLMYSQIEDIVNEFIGGDANE